MGKASKWEAMTVRRQEENGKGQGRDVKMTRWLSGKEGITCFAMLTGGSELRDRGIDGADNAALC